MIPNVHRTEHLEQGRQWIEDYCNLLERLINDLGYELKITGGEKYADEQMKFNFNGQFENEDEVQTKLNDLFFRYRRRTSVIKNVIFISPIPRKEWTGMVIGGMRWIENK